MAPATHEPCSADFQVCCIAGFQTRRPQDDTRAADLEIGETAGFGNLRYEASGSRFDAAPLGQPSPALLSRSDAARRRNLQPRAPVA